MPKQTTPTPGPDSRCSLLTNHGHVFLGLAADPSATMRTVAARVGLTERGVQRIVSDLATAGYVTVTRVGRQNEYEVHLEAPIRGPFTGGLTAGHLIGARKPTAK
jgi:hypothetical protein